jgi:hypothetical protein
MTQTAQILEMLKRGPVTAMDALNTCNCFRLAARIKDLRDAGHEIETTTIETQSGKHVAQYHLKEKETC